MVNHCLDHQSTLTLATLLKREHWGAAWAKQAEFQDSHFRENLPMPQTGWGQPSAPSKEPISAMGGTNTKKSSSPQLEVLSSHLTTFYIDI